MYKNNAKIGFVGFTYPAPADLTRVEKIFWQMEVAKELGCEVFLHYIFDLNPEEEKQVDDKIGEYGFETEGSLHPSAFDLAGWQGADPVKALETFEKSLEVSKAKGLKILIGRYGQLIHKTSRWNLTPGWTGAEQKENLTASLKIAAPLLEKYGLYTGIENHIDFSGKEFDEIFSAVGSAHVGCNYDTANSLFTNMDPNLDIDYMPKWAISTHIKDAKMVDSPFSGANGPLIPVGCELGTGNVDIKRIIDEVLDKSPMKDGIHLILESGWFGKAVQDANPDMDEFRRKDTIASLDFIKKCITI